MNKKNKHKDFQKILDEHKGIIYKVAHTYCADDEDRKDLVQEIATQIWKALPTYKPQYKMSTWMYRVALNVAISNYRKRLTRQRTFAPLTENVNVIVDESVDDMDANITILHQFIRELKELDKALMLLYLEQKSHKEIAEIVGITETNVATKIGRIKVKLREKFSSIKQEK